MTELLKYHKEAPARLPPEWAKMSVLLYYYVRALQALGATSAYLMIRRDKIMSLGPRRGRDCLTGARFDHSADLLFTGELYQFYYTRFTGLAFNASLGRMLRKNDKHLAVVR